MATKETSETHRSNPCFAFEFWIVSFLDLVVPSWYTCPRNLFQLEADLLENWCPPVEVAFAGMDPDTMNSLNFLKKDQGMGGSLAESL